MCRKNVLHGCCLLFLGLGIMVGHCISSWLLCVFLGLGFICLGCHLSKQR